MVAPVWILHLTAVLLIFKFLYHVSFRSVSLIFPSNCSFASFAVCILLVFVLRSDLFFYIYCTVSLSQFLKSRFPYSFDSFSFCSDNSASQVLYFVNIFIAYEFQFRFYLFTLPVYLCIFLEFQVSS